MSDDATLVLAKKDVTLLDALRHLLPSGAKSGDGSTSFAELPPRRAGEQVKPVIHKQRKIRQHCRGSVHTIYVGWNPRLQQVLETNSPCP